MIYANFEFVYKVPSYIHVASKFKFRRIFERI